MSGCQSGIFPSGFLIKTLCVFLCAPFSATYPAHHIVFDFNTLIIFHDKNRTQEA